MDGDNNKGKVPTRFNNANGKLKDLCAWQVCPLVSGCVFSVPVIGTESFQNLGPNHGCNISTSLEFTTFQCLTGEGLHVSGYRYSAWQLQSSDILNKAGIIYPGNPVKIMDWGEKF